MSVKQKIKFIGQPNQIYSISKNSFPYNVWITITPTELHKIIEFNITHLFEFNPPLPIVTNYEVEEKKKPKRKRKKKEVKE